MATFSAKIDLAFALGLMDSELHRHLHTMRKIRNIFAHAATETDFEEKNVAALLSKLPVAKEKEDDSFEVQFLMNAMHCNSEIMSALEVVDEGEGVVPASLR